MTWIQTHCGHRFDLLKPDPDRISIIDIAQSLSQSCRFNGHLTEFFSIAQHSVAVAKVLPDEFRLWGLLHDAAEAYVCDLPRPLKHLPQMQFYRDVEDGILKVIAKKFNLPWPMPPEVKHADDVILATEKKLYLKPCECEWGDELPPPTSTWLGLPWTPPEACFHYLEIYESEMRGLP